MTPQERQYIAQSKAWEQRLLQEAIAHAQQNGAARIVFPGQETIATIEKYIKPNPYTNEYGDEYVGELKAGDTIFREEVIYRDDSTNLNPITEQSECIVLRADGRNVDLVRKDNLMGAEEQVTDNWIMIDGERAYYDSLDVITDRQPAAYAQPLKDLTDAQKKVLEKYEQTAKLLRDKYGDRVHDYWDKDNNHWIALELEGMESEPIVAMHIVGERGAAALDKYEQASMRMDNLAIARKMEEAKKDARTIKLATGWERGGDGKWRYEIKDIDITYNGQNKLSGYDKLRRTAASPLFRINQSMPLLSLFTRAARGFMLPEVMEMGENHELYKAYPQLKKLRVTIDQYYDIKEVGALPAGAYDKATNTISLHRGFLNAQGAGSINRLLIHEVQHAIQSIEGFEGGTNPKDAGSEDNYHKSAGEVEARNAMKRRYMDMDERRRTLLSDTEDVARKDQLFIEQAYDELQAYMEGNDSRQKSRSEIDEFFDDALEEFYDDDVRLHAVRSNPPSAAYNPKRNAWTAIVETIADSYQRLYDVEEYLAKKMGKPIVAARSAYDGVTKIMPKVREQMLDFQKRIFSPLVVKAEELGNMVSKKLHNVTVPNSLNMNLYGNNFINDFLNATGRKLTEMYMMAKHASERNAYLKKERGVESGSGITDADAAWVVQQYEQALSQQEVDDLWAVTRAATRTALTAWTAGHRISVKEKNALEARWKYYVPLKGWEGNPHTDENTEHDNWFIDRKGGVFAPYKHAKGRRSIADSPLANIAQSAMSAMLFKEKNNVRKKLMKLLIDSQAKEVGVVINADASAAFKYKQLDDTLPAAWDKADKELHIVKVWSGGRELNMYLADARLAREFNGNDWLSKISSWLGNTYVARLTRWIAAMRTQKNPVFWAKNTVRDQRGATARLFIMHGAGMAWEFKKQLPRAGMTAFRAEFADGKGNSAKQQQLWDEYRHSGARIGFMQLRDISRIKKDMTKIVKNNGKNGSVIGRAINGMAAVSEDITRFAAFSAARRRGMSIKDAGNIAKEVSVNFNRSGRFKGLNMFYAFFNANIQAIANHVEMFKVHPVRASIVAAVNIAMGYGIYALNRGLINLWWDDDDDDDDDSLKGITDFKKYTNTFIPNPLSKDGFMLLPVSQTWRPFYALGVAFAQVHSGERTMKEALAGVSDMFGTYMPSQVGSVVKGALDGDLKHMLTAVSPDIVKPITESFIERKDYMGRDLVAYEYNDPEGEKVPFYKRPVSTTQNPAWQLLAEIISPKTETGRGKENYVAGTGKEAELEVRTIGHGVSADQVRNVVLGFTGVVGSAVNDIANAAYSLLTGDDVTPNKLPFVSSFYAESMPGYYTHKYYELKKKFDDIQEGADFDMETGRIKKYFNEYESYMKKEGGSMYKGDALIKNAKENYLKEEMKAWDEHEDRLNVIKFEDLVVHKTRDERRRAVEAEAKRVIKEVEAIRAAYKMGMDDRAVDKMVREMDMETERKRNKKKK